VISDESPPLRPNTSVQQPYGLHDHAARVMVAVAIVALAALVVYLRAVVVLVFGSVLVAVALRIGSNAMQRATGLSDGVALAAAVLLTLAMLAIGVVLLGDPISEQFAALRSALPAAQQATTRWLNSHAVGLWLLRWWDGGNAGGALLMIVTGLYLAANPGLYRRGMLLLLPQPQRARVDAALAAAGNGLSRWLLGQAVAMALVGVMTAVGLAAIGMPLALPLGIIAGILEFVPFFGPIATGALIVLLAFTQGAAQAAYAGLVCFFVQHFEGYVIQPFVQRWAIALPPALGLISVIVFSLLFGALGALFAVPLMVVLMILVQRLWVDGALAATPPHPAVRAREPRLPSALRHAVDAVAHIRRSSHE
jgi:predicted PurR-regulated permease PerM